MLKNGKPDEIYLLVEDDQMPYWLPENVKVINVSKQALREACEKYGILVQKNEVGDWGLSKYDFRRVHHYLYDEGRDKNKANSEDDPWN